jgi:catechol-2,3-dioxygenase
MPGIITHKGTVVMNTQNKRIKALGEIALRVTDLDALQKFYEETIGLELMKRFPNAAFFRIAEGFGGHTQVLALFDRSAEEGFCGISPEKSTIDHIAFEIPLADFTVEKQRLEQLGLRVETAEHAWVHWRSLYVNDPEGNQVELVCYDESV